MKRQTVIGKNALVIAGVGEKQMAAQVFNYSDVREIRLDLEKFEVKLLMNYDDAYFRVYSANPDMANQEQVTKATQMVTKFYNDLINASMKLTEEELENIKKQREQLAMTAKNAQAATQTETQEEEIESDELATKE